MRQFDFYEFAGLLVPGTTVLLALAAFFPAIPGGISGSSLGLGEVAAGSGVAYGLGHVVQAFGNLLEAGWWKLPGGMPSDWVGTGKASFLHARQVEALPGKIAEQLGIGGITLGGGTGWHGITRQIYAAVSAAGRSGRVDTFNGNYGLCRGLAASFLFVAVLIVLRLGWSGRPYLSLASSAFLLAGWRAHRFGVHYARELFVQFLQLPKSRKGPSNVQRLRNRHALTWQC